ncbi:PE-PGRS family protein [Streptomyces sp. RGM 3693]|uniref:PE-PGRS family protein n=1 Tax=Streptomyces sp. RGM 3693 TaxID=3413284 RepID=UPI003D285632
MSAMTTGSAARAARAATFAAVCVTTTALGHALMSGAVPWWALGAAFFGTGAAAYCLTGRERGVLVVTGSTVAAQLGLHSLFGLAQASASTSASLSTSALLSPAQWATALMCGATGTSPGRDAQTAAMRLLRNAGRTPVTMHGSSATPMGGIPGMEAMPGMDMSHPDQMTPMSHVGHGALGMFLAHLLAALLCGLWLWRGEAAVFRLARSLAGLLFTPLLTVLATHGWTGLSLPARPLATMPVPTLRAALLHNVVSRRGPPRPSCCF